MDKQFQTDLAKVKGLGAAKTGTLHWWHQRLTSLILIPLSLWFVIMLLCITYKGEAAIFSLFASPLQTLIASLFMLFTLYHGVLGMQVIIEDYVHNKLVNQFLLLTIKFISLVTGGATLGAILSLHIALFKLG